MRRVPPRAALRGFTLIEIIIVVLVFAVMSVMAYGGLNSVLRTRAGIETSMQRTASMQRAFQRLRSDFQNLRDRPARDSFGDAQAAFSADREGVVNLVRGGWRSPVQSGRSSLERVSYRLQDKVLRRSSWRVLDLPQDAKPSDLALLKDVEELRWRFLDTAGEWRAQWPASDTLAGESSADEAPPMAVELTLVTKDWGETRLLFRTPLAGLGSGQSSGDGTTVSQNLLTRGGLLPGNLVGSSTLPPPGTGDTADETPPQADPTPDTNPDETPQDQGTPDQQVESPDREGDL